MALLACSMGMAAAAQAEVSFAFGVTAENQNLGSYAYNYPDAQTSGVLSTSGALVAQAGRVSASVNAWADARTGMFKAITRVEIDNAGQRPIDIVEAYARLDLTDTLVFSSAGPTATAEFRLSYDTEISGLGFSAFPREAQLSHFQQVWSFRQLTLSYDVANPSFDPSATCIDYGSDGQYCPPETQQYITIEKSAGNGQFREVALGGPNGIYTNGDAVNGRYTGTEVLTLDVPTGVEVRLSYTAYNMARCFHMNACALVNDASHSDYLGLVAPQGFSSASGYEYLGVAAAVPEPASAWMGLAGLGLLAGVLRRRR
jgi:MYXO-CTERM domain-containing protein